MAHNYSDSAEATTLSADFDSDSSPTLTVAASVGYPAVPFYIAIKRGQSAQQILSVTAVAGTTWTVTAVSGSSATHAAGSPVEHVAPATFFDSVDEHLDATAAHGASGAVVGTTNTQTLTGKTMSGASNTFTAIPQSSITSLTTDLGALDTRLDTIEAGALPVFAVKTAVQTVTSSTTFVDDNHLFVDLQAGVYYEIVLHAAVSGGAGDIKTRWGTTGTISGVGSRAVLGLGTSAATRDNVGMLNVAAAGITGAVGTGTSTDGLISLLHEEMIVQCTGAGRLTFQWAQTTSSATATNVWNSSWIRAIPLS